MDSKENTNHEKAAVLVDSGCDIAQECLDRFGMWLLPLHIDYEEKAFFDILVAVAEKFHFEFPESKNIELAKEIRAALRDKEKYSDWANSSQIKALMQADIIMILAKHGYPPTPPEIYEKVYSDILEQAENFKKYSDD